MAVQFQSHGTSLLWFRGETSIFALPHLCCPTGLAQSSTSTRAVICMAPLKMQRAVLKLLPACTKVLTGHSETSNTRQGCLGMMRATSALRPPRDQQTPFPHPSFRRARITYIARTCLRERKDSVINQLGRTLASHHRPTNLGGQWMWSMDVVNGARRGGAKRTFRQNAYSARHGGFALALFCSLLPAPCATWAIPADTRLVIAEASMANAQNVAAVPAIPIPL